MGIRTISVYSEQDRKSMHVELADESYFLGPAAAAQSYLNQEKILEVAQCSDAHAIHPGYGFLSENADFASLCNSSGVHFIGPSASAIRNMGIKSKAKEIMATAGVPIIYGYHGANQSDSFLADQAANMGFPVMIKAIKGGGGKGMRICHSATEFQQMLDSARRESAKAFGDDSVLIEKFIRKPRHVEVQVFGDHYGNYVHLFERDCSVQRRHQKIIEEAPGPGISQETRSRLGTAAVQAARAVDYVGAGTVEFILDTHDGQFYFMEMNTRLQVEHPVTEYISGTDLVEWQIRVASGEPLPLTQEQLKEPKGHAFEARIYAEDTENGFMPAPGPLRHLIFPEENPDQGIRIESGVKAGDEVSVHYDPMIAKIVVWDEDRVKSLAKLRRALTHTQITGLRTNTDFLLRLASSPDFIDGNVYTDFIQDRKDALTAVPPPDDSIITAAAFGSLIHSMNECDSIRTLPPDLKNFRTIAAAPPVEFISLNYKDKSYPLQFTLIDRSSDTYRATLKGSPVGEISGTLDPTGRLVIWRRENGKRQVFRLLISEDTLTLFTDDPLAHSFEFEHTYPSFLQKGSSTSGASTSGNITSPMPGVVEHILVKEGDEVKAGDTLLVLIAMKMEYSLKTPVDGIVRSLPHAAGQNVSKGALLAVVE